MYEKQNLPSSWVSSFSVALFSDPVNNFLKKSDILKVWWNLKTQNMNQTRQVIQFNIDNFKWIEKSKVQNPGCPATLSYDIFDTPRVQNKYRQVR